MPQVGVALAALHFGPRHAMAAIDFRFDDVVLCRRYEAGPTGARVKLGFRPEQRLPTTDAFIGAGGLGVLVFAAEGRLRSLLSGHKVLIRRKLLPPSMVVFLDLLLVHFPSCPF